MQRERERERRFGVNAIITFFSRSHLVNIFSLKMRVSSKELFYSLKNLVFMTTARLSDLSMPLKGEVRRSPEQSARQPIARSGKFVRRAYSRRALDCENDDGLTCMYAFSHPDHGAHFCLRGGWGKSGDLTWHPAVKHQRPAAKTTNSNCWDRTLAQVKAAHTRTARVKEQQVLSKYWKKESNLY